MRLLHSSVTLIVDLFVYEIVFFFFYIRLCTRKYTSNKLIKKNMQLLLHILFDTQFCFALK